MPAWQLVHRQQCAKAAAFFDTDPGNISQAMY